MRAIDAISSPASPTNVSVPRRQLLMFGANCKAAARYSPRRSNTRPGIAAAIRSLYSLDRTDVSIGTSFMR